MSKTYRLVIIVVVVAVCFVFLWPTLSWYFFTPKAQQTLALGTREQIKEYATRQGLTGAQELIAAGQAGKDVPADLEFLVPLAKKQVKNLGEKAPDKWDAKAVLATYPSKDDLQTAIEDNYRDKIFKLKDTQGNAVQLGLDLSGGMSIILQADMDDLKTKLGHTPTSADVDDAMQRAMEVLNSRIDKFGLTEPVIRRQGTDQIYIEIPGAADPEKINSIIMGKGSLNFRIVDSDAVQTFNTYYSAHPTDTFNADGTLKDPGIIPSDDEVMGYYTQDSYGLDEFQSYTVVKKAIGLDGNYIQSAQVERDNLTGKPNVTFKLSSEGGDIFFKLTSANVQKVMAIVLDGRVRAQATIQQPIHDQVQLTGFGQDEANSIALILRTAALPVALNVVNQQQIGASEGADSIRQGLYALIGGLLAVLIFMLAYYRVGGINADIAQILNMYLMFSVLSAFNFTLTLPSIAGFILTIGMAVDANVIIFERMKEEIRLGKTRKAVVEAGFDKAFWAIMDSNITTFIAALFLSQLGSGPIQGFAVSLAVGVVSSVFTALFVSRLIFDFGTDVLKGKKVRVSWRTTIKLDKNGNVVGPKTTAPTVATAGEGGQK
jgi:preprotein translocase subunit SecD